MNDGLFDRYIRQNSIDWLSREKLSKMAFAVIGAGAIGNEVIKNLSLLGVGQIDVYDFDKIEVHNLTKSILFREEDVGKNKADCAVERASCLDANVKFKAFNGDFWDNLTLSGIRKYNSVICCVDNFEARIKLNRLCIIAGVDFINTGIDSRYASVEYFPFSLGGKVPCYECNLPNSAYQKASKRYSCGWIRRRALEIEAVPTTIMTSSIAGAVAVSYAVSHITGEEAKPDASRLLFDTKTLITSLANISKNSECGGCSDLVCSNLIIPVKNSTQVSNMDKTLEEAVFTSSDQIIIDYKCRNACTIDPGQYVLKQARKFDDSVFTCPSCLHNSIELSIKDQFTGKEILEIFNGGEIPAKYLKTKLGDKNIFLDLEV